MSFYLFEIRGRLAEIFGRWSWRRPLRPLYSCAAPFEKVVTCRMDISRDKRGKRDGEISVMSNEFTESQFPQVVYRFSCEDTRVPEDVIVNELSRAFVRDIEKKVKGEL